MDENWTKRMKIHKNRCKNGWKYLKMNPNRWKWIEMDDKSSKWTKMYENWWKYIQKGIKIDKKK